jgi:NADH-quinone oxidoreductase subunit N
VAGSLYYLFTYTFMVIGSFAVITVIGGTGDTRHDLDNYRGLGGRRPWLAGSLAVLLMAQAGIPFTTGFLAKLEVVSASVGGRSTALAVVAMVSAAIAAFFYLRVILLMYTPPTTSGGSADAEPSSSAGTGDADEAAPRGATEGAIEGETAGTLTLVVGSSEDLDPAPVSFTMVTAIAVCLAVTVLFGVWPAPLVDFAHKATLLLR